MLELKKMSACIRHNEERFAEILARKTNSDRLLEEKYLKTELERLMSRNAKVERNYEKLYEDNMDGKVTDEWFMHMSRKYEEERLELRIVIHYRFVGYIEIPSNADNYKADTRQGVAVEYLTA